MTNHRSKAAVATARHDGVGATARGRPLSTAGSFFVALFYNLLICALVATGSALAQDDQPLVVVFDGSGSMWGAIDGTRKSKLAISRESLAGSVKRHDSDTTIGLVTFGARSGDSCRSVETAVQPAPRRIDDLSTVLAGFNPQGRGPVVLGLEMARDLVSGGADGQILLIHDGDDNCGGDLCAFADAFAKSHPGIKINALSIGLKRTDRDSVACLTKATGGRWVEADNADDVANGIERIIADLDRPRRPSAERAAPADSKPVAQAPSAPQPANATPQPAPGANVELEAVLKASGAAIPSGVTWHIKSVGDNGDDAFERRVDRPSAAVKLAPGRYRVALETRLQRQAQTVEVEADVPSKVSFALEGGFIGIRTAGRTDGKGPQPIATVEAVTESGAPESVLWSGTVGADSGFLVQAGRYRITVSDGLYKVAQAIELNEGEARALALSPPGAHLKVRVAGIDDRQLGHAIIEIAADDPTAPNGKRPIARSAATAADFNLPPGTYHVTLSVFGAKNTKIVVLPGGETVDAKIDIDQMGLTVTSHLGAKGPVETEGVRYRLWQADALEEPLHVSRAGKAIFYLTPGKYRIESRIGQQNAVIVREFEIGRQRYGTLALRHDASRVAFKLANDEAPADSNALWELRDRNQLLIWRTITASPVMTLKAGLYTVRVEAGQKTYGARFGVVAGHDQSVILGEE